MFKWGAATEQTALQIAALRVLAAIEASDPAAADEPPVTAESTARCSNAPEAEPGAAGSCCCKDCCLLNDVKRNGHYDLQWYYAELDGTAAHAATSAPMAAREPEGSDQATRPRKKARRSVGVPRRRW